MITLKQAFDIAKRRFSNEVITGCLDVGDYYTFNSTPRDWDGTRDGLFRGRAIYAVCKDTGKEAWLSVLDYSDILDAGHKKISMDITPYLSPKDAEFAERVRRVVAENP